MVACEYCLKDCKKRVRYFFIVIEHDEPIHPDGIEAHVDENHHRIMVCKKCEEKIFKAREGGVSYLESKKKGNSPTRKSSPKKGNSPTRKSSPKKGNSPTRKSSPKKGNSPTRKSSPKK